MVTFVISMCKGNNSHKKLSDSFTAVRFNYAYKFSKMLKLSLIPLSYIHLEYFPEEITVKNFLKAIVLWKRTQI
jgi:hypothetical protein